jgi:hypothetical protein
LTTASEATTVSAVVAGHAVVRASVEELKALRHNPGPTGSEPLPPAFLKHADDQTVAGLAAVLRTIETHGWPQNQFTGWGVLASPRFFGRATLAQALKRFQQEGAWGVSPHLVPHRSLHSLSGTVSQALKIHGPNLGVGGGAEGAGKAMLTAAAWLACDGLAGVWVVLTGWNWEPGLDTPRASEHNGDHAQPPVCMAAALALTCDSCEPSTSESFRMRISATAVPAPDERGLEPPFTLEALGDALDQHDDAASAWRFDCGGRLELEKIGTPAEKSS